ncbi:MAG: DapH/DapD/GlmU-related protein [Dehalococcoidia bacterium]
MKQFTAIVLAPPDPAPPRLAGRTAVEWLAACATEAGYHATESAGLSTESAEASTHLLVLDARWPLLQAATVNDLVGRHLEQGADLTLLLSAEGEAVGDDTLCALCLRRDWLHEASQPPNQSSMTALAASAVRASARLAALSLPPEQAQRISAMSSLPPIERELRSRINLRAMESGVRLVDPGTTYIDVGVTIEPGATIHPNTHLRGDTRIERGCEIGPNAVIEDAHIGAGSRIGGSTIERSTLEPDVVVGPYSHIRDGAHIGRGARIGNYAEIKNARLGPLTRMHHFGYLGDADVGEDVNIGAGVVTVNYDGVDKHRTTIGDGAFIGSDTMLVAPVTVGARARTAAGAVVINDVAPGELVMGVPARAKTSAQSNPGSSS